MRSAGSPASFGRRDDAGPERACGGFVGRRGVLMAPLGAVLNDHLADVRLVDAVGHVALTGRARSADAAELCIPWLVRMVLAHPADAFADRTGRLHAFDKPLNEHARSNPSPVMSRYSTSA